MKEIPIYVGAVCFIIVLSILTGMIKQPWWFRFIYEFPILSLITNYCKNYYDNGKD